MIYILHLECATKVCSVALSKNGTLLDFIDLNSDNYQHNEKLTLIIDELIKKNNISYNNISAVSISSGPGSYTGLRISVSVAKGLCYSLQIPIISILTLNCLYEASKEYYPNERVLTMLDARRLEVYSSIFEKDTVLKELSSDILDENSYFEFNDKQIIIVGDGAEKTKTIWNDRNIIYDDSIILSAKYQVNIAWKKYNNSEFESLAYFEPLYLKEFICK